MTKPKLVPEPRACEWCGEMFQPRYVCARWCDILCNHAQRYAERVGYDPRLARRFPFVTTGGPVCRAAYHYSGVWASAAARPRLFSAGYCAECGESFVVVAGKGDKYCGVACNDRAVRRASKQRRRRALRGSGLIHPRKVFERDGWVCRLCGAPTDREAVVPAARAATVDHILPVALGGEHVYSNVQCAHFICNVRKGADVDQLAFAA